MFPYINVIDVYYYRNREEKVLYQSITYVKVLNKVLDLRYMITTVSMDRPRTEITLRKSYGGKL